MAAAAATAAAANDELAAWRALFRVEGSSLPTPASVKQSLDAERKRAAMVVVRLAYLESEHNRLQQTLQQLHAASQPPRQSLIDPAINALFTKLKEDLKAAELRAKQLEEDNHALQFTPNSALGRRLLARCRQLLAENEALSAQAGDGKAAALDAALTVERALTTELRMALEEAQNGALVLDEELERLQSLLLRSRKRQREEEGDVKLEAENEKRERGADKQQDVSKADEDRDAKSASTPGEVSIADT